MEPQREVDFVLEQLWSPIAALTAADGGRANGLITSTAVTAGLLPESPRVCVLLARASLTHELVLASRAFALHLLSAADPTRSVEIFRALGFSSGREGEKLSGIPWHAGVTAAPLLDEALAYVEARVVTTVAADEITIVLADVVGGGRLREGPQLTIDDIRARLTEAEFAAWDSRRAEELADARRLRAERAAEYIAER